MEEQEDLMQLAADDEVAAVSESINEDDAAEPQIPEIADSPKVVSAEDADEEEHSEKRLIVFICHRQLPGLDQNIASLINEELSPDYEVYFDEAQPPAVDWAASIQEKLDNADFVIALITESANQLGSDWIAFELSLAHRRRRLTGKPTIIPVHLEPIGEYKAHIGAFLAAFQRIDYTGDNSRLLADIRRALEGGEPVQDPSVLERFRIPKSQLQLMRAANVNMPAFDRARSMLQRDKLIWIMGDASVRNYVALSLAIQQQTLSQITDTEGGETSTIYEVPRPLSWSKVYNTLISNSIIILSDVASANISDDQTQNNELRYLDFIISRNNFLIVTASADSFSEIQQEMRKQEFHRGGVLEVNHAFYDQDAKLRMFDQLLAYSKENGEISPRQLDWARRVEAHETLMSIIDKLSPSDIERFITRHLPEVKRPADIPRLLQRNADLDNEIHSWFVSLDDSTRCFVMVVALFGDLHRKNFWAKYKEVVGSLHKLDATLSMSPLGICRERAALYVPVEGPLGFTEERIADAIHREMAKNYREYFLELLPLLEDWSVPAGRNGNRAAAMSEARRKEAIKSQPFRNAIAHMVGRMGQYGLTDVRVLVDRWATDPIMQVRDAVASSFEQAALGSLGAKHVLALLDEWCVDPSADDNALFKTCAAASALGSIAAAYPNRQLYAEAIDRLETLARDIRRSVRFYVSIPLKRVVRRVQLTDKIEHLLTLVIQDHQVSTRINVAETLNEARVFNAPVAQPVLDRWLSADDPYQRWAATCSLILYWLRHGDRKKAAENLNSLLVQAPELFVSILTEIVDHRYYKKQAQSFFTKAVLYGSDNIRNALVSGMARVDFGLIFERLLKGMKPSGKPAFDELVVEVRRKRWCVLLEDTEEFSRDLAETLRSGPVSPEVYRALIDILTPEPDGYRQQAAAALANGFPHNHVEFDKLLKKLTQLAPTSLESFSSDARREAFIRLFHVPDLFVQTASEYLEDPHTKTQAREAIEMLALPSSAGYREELLQTLATSYSLNQQATKRFLGQLRTSDELRSLTYEFTLNLIEGMLERPEALYSNLREAINDQSQWAETILALKRLAISEPWGARKALVQALALTRASLPDDMDDLLQHPAFLSESELAGLRTEVKLASVLNRVFVPRFVARFFVPR